MICFCLPLYFHPSSFCTGLSMLQPQGPWSVSLTGLCSLPPADFGFLQPSRKASCQYQFPLNMHSYGIMDLLCSTSYSCNFTITCMIFKLLSVCPTLDCKLGRGHSYIYSILYSLYLVKRLGHSMSSINIFEWRNK